MSKILEEAAQEAAAVVKKLLAGKGDLLGSFYFVGDTTAKEAALALTLQARDPKGEKAATRGKALRAEIKNAKTARGVITVEGTTLIFELHSGSASASVIRQAFKKNLAALPGLGPLKKARVRGGEDDEAPEVVEEDAPSAAPGTPVEDEVDLSDIDPQELEDLRAAQGALGRLNQSLQTFLSQEEAEVDLGEQLAQKLDELSALTRQDPRDERAIAAARRELASLASSGPQPFPEVGQPLTPELKEVLSGAIDTAVSALTRFLTRAIEAIQGLHSETMAIPDPDKLEEDRRKTMLAELTRSTAAVVSYREQLRTNLVSVVQE